VLKAPRLLTLIVGLVLVAPRVGRGQSPDSTPASQEVPVSADRISDGLHRPELQIPPVVLSQEPTFRTSVTGKLETPLDVIRRELREEARLHPWENAHYTPGVVAQVDVIPALMSLITKIKTIRREHAEAEARQMVQQELAAFCSEHDCAEAAELPVEGVILPR
jgi:hypothetical protein